MSKPETKGGQQITERDMRGDYSSPAEIRHYGAWYRGFDGPGEQLVRDLAGQRPEMFGEKNGVPFLRGRCCHCGREQRLPLEGVFSTAVADRDGDLTEQREAIEVSSSMVSVVALQAAQRMACGECIARLEAEEERKHRTQRLDERLRASGLPTAMAAECTWESIIEKGRSEVETGKRASAIDACRRWAADKKPGRGILLWGPPGSGKTRLAATTAASRLSHSPITWVSVAVLMAELEGSWADQDRQKALKVLTSKAPAVLDDFDKVPPLNARVRSQLFAAIDKREQARTPMLVTTNLKPSALKETLGDVFVSRLLGMCTVYEYPGPDLRLQVGEEPAS